MELVQENWISQLSKSAINRDVEKKKWEERDKVLTQLRQTVADERDRLLKDMNLRVYDDESAVETDEHGVTKQKSKKSKRDKNHEQSTLDYGSRDQTNEFDWAEQFEGWNVMTDEDLIKHADATNLIDGLVGGLEEATIEIENPPGSGNMETVKLFEKEDIQNEFYTPMVREGLLPETFVPDDYSRTAKMIEGAFDEYKERLEEEGFSKAAVFGECLKFGVTLASAGASFAGSVATFKEAANLKPEDVQWSKFGVFEKGNEDTDWIKKLSEKGDKDLKEFTDVLSKGIDAFKDIGVEGSIAIQEKLAKKYEDSTKVLEPMDRRAMMAPRIIDSLISGVSMVVSESLNRWEIGLAASTVYRSGVDAKPLVKTLQSDEKEELDDEDGTAIILALCAGFEKVLSVCPDSVKIISQKATASITASFKSLKGSAIADPINSENYSGAMAVASKAASDAMAVVLKDDEFCQMMSANKGELIKELGNKMTEDFANRLNEVEENQRKEMELIKSAKTAKEKAPLIAKKIAEIEKCRAALKWAKAFSSLGVAVASKFFAPLAIAGSAISLAENLAEAIIRVRDAINFIESEGDMLRDASPFSAPIANFVHNAEIQAIHFEIRAACDLINMIGAIVETAGYASGPGAAIGVVVGKTMQATASASSALESVMYDIAKKIDARLGWSKYKEALLKPENRKLALLAMKANPTLAKYSVAWGAIIEKDVLVSDFLTKTGLTVESLQETNASVGLVVKYLETRMPEDNIVVGMEGLAKDWAPAPQLTLECWHAVIRRGQEKGKLVVEGSESQIKDVEYAILACTSPWSEMTKVPKGQAPAEKILSECLLAHTNLTNVISRYRPHRMVKDKLIEHAQMKEFLGSLNGLVRVRIEWLQSEGWKEKGKDDE